MPKKYIPNNENAQVSTKLYDLIMGVIEPDLVSSRLPVLEIFYKGESPEAHEARMARYERAYTQCEQVIGKLEITLQEEVRAARRVSGAKVARAEQEEQERHVENMEILINSSDDNA